MKKHTKGYKTIILKVPEDIIKSATHSLKIKGNELKDYLLDMLKRSVTIVKKGSYSKDPIWNIAGLGKSKVKDLSTCHDKYLYGLKSR